MENILDRLNDVDRAFKSIRTGKPFTMPGEVTKEELAPKEMGDIIMKAEGLIATVKAAKDNLESGDFEGAKALLKEAEEGTDCQICVHELKRAIADLNHAVELCVMEEKDCPEKTKMVSVRLMTLEDNLTNALENIKQ
ncbi:hypothetical protein LCGC14_2340840, partial [marine sediment metagenome]